MRTNDLCRVFGRLDIGRIIATDVGPDPFQHDQTQEYVYTEFSDGRYWFHRSDVSWVGTPANNSAQQRMTRFVSEVDVREAYEE